MSSLHPIISLLVVIQVHFASRELVSSYVKFVTALGEEHTKLKTKDSTELRRCTYIAEMVPKNALNALMCHTNTDCRASRFKAYAKCIRAPSPRKRDYKHCVKKFASPRL